MRNVSHPGPIHSLMQHTADLIFSDLDKNIDSMFVIIIFSYNTSLEIRSLTAHLEIARALSF